MQGAGCFRGLKHCSYSRQPPSQLQWHTVDKGDRKRGKERETKRELRRERERERERDMVTKIVPGSNTLISHCSARKWPKSSRFPSDTHIHTHTGLALHCLHAFALNKLNLFISFHLNNYINAVRLSNLIHPSYRPRKKGVPFKIPLKICDINTFHAKRSDWKKKTDNSTAWWLKRYTDITRLNMILLNSLQSAVWRAHNS